MTASIAPVHAEVDQTLDTVGMHTLHCGDVIVPYGDIQYDEGPLFHCRNLVPATPIAISAAWIILGAIYSPLEILRWLQKFNGLFSYMERVFLSKIYSPNIY